MAWVAAEVGEPLRPVQPSRGMSLVAWTRVGRAGASGERQAAVARGVVQPLQQQGAAAGRALLDQLQAMPPVQLGAPRALLWLGTLQALLQVLKMAGVAEQKLVLRRQLLEVAWSPPPSCPCAVFPETTTAGHGGTGQVNSAV